MGITDKYVIHKLKNGTGLKVEDWANSYYQKMDLFEQIEIELTAFSGGGLSDMA